MARLGQERIRMGSFKSLQVDDDSQFTSQYKVQWCVRGLHSDLNQMSNIQCVQRAAQVIH